MSIRPFSDLLRELRYGEALDELSAALNELVAHCVASNKPGELTLKLKLKPSKSGAIEITDAVTVAGPKPERGSSLFFATPENNLIRNNPRQTNLDLRQVDTDGPAPRVVDTATPAPVQQTGAA
ncbi:MAG TPA: hypothetical protein VGH74_07715 [Planctomycetaceae bacterium]|jgi:hypothetical protein